MCGHALEWGLPVLKYALFLTLGGPTLLIGTCFIVQSCVIELQINET